MSLSLLSLWILTVSLRFAEISVQYIATPGMLDGQFKMTMTAVLICLENRTREQINIMQCNPHTVCTCKHTLLCCHTNISSLFFCPRFFLVAVIFTGCWSYVID